MDKPELLENIMEMLALIADDERKLLKIYSFIEKEILNSKENIGEKDILKRYEDTIPQIINAINSGMVCFLNPDTLEIEQAPNNTLFDLEDYEEQHDDRIDDFDMNYMQWETYIKFEPVPYNEQYRIMERFIFKLDDEELASKLETSLSQDYGINNFKSVVQDSHRRNMWEHFYDEAIENYVRTILMEGLKNTDEIEKSDMGEIS